MPPEIRELEKVVSTGDSISSEMQRHTMACRRKNNPTLSCNYTHTSCNDYIILYITQLTFTSFTTYSPLTTCTATKPWILLYKFLAVRNGVNNYTFVILYLHFVFLAQTICACFYKQILYWFSYFVAIIAANATH